MNTKIYYMYRDAGNWKQHNEAVVSGEITLQQMQTIKNCCDGEHFIPRQIGLPEKRFADITDLDHCWFEFDWPVNWPEDDPVFFRNTPFEITSEEPTEDMTVDELVAAFEKAKQDGWDEDKYAI